MRSARSIELDGRPFPDYRHPSRRFQFLQLDARCVGAAHDVSGLGSASRARAAAGSWSVVGRLRPNVTF